MGLIACMAESPQHSIDPNLSTGAAPFSPLSLLLSCAAVFPRRQAHRHFAHGLLKFVSTSYRDSILFYSCGSSCSVRSRLTVHRVGATNY